MKWKEYSISKDDKCKVVCWELVDSGASAEDTENKPSLERLNEVAIKEFSGIPFKYLEVSGDSEGVYLSHSL